MDFKDYYDILGVAPDADQKTIKTAYRRLARKYHPDVSKEKDAEKQFKEVSEAYEVLSDEAKREEYEQLRKYGRKGEAFQPPPGWNQGASGGANETDFSDFFSSIFGNQAGRSSQHGSSRGQSRHAQRGQDVEIDMPIFLEDTLTDDAKPLSYRLSHLDEMGRQNEINKNLKLRIPKGVSDGERVRLKGQGGPGYGKGPAGDLYVRIKFAPHPLFDVADHDLTLTVPITPWEAALGTTVTVPTLSKPINLTIAAESQAGQKLRVRGKGLATKAGHGDLFVLLKIVMPKTIDETSKRLWQELADKSDFNPRAKLKV